MVPGAQADPMEIFAQWLREAEGCLDIADATAMCLATADAQGIPAARMVLLKATDPRGFVFYTNITSQKGADLAENPQAALCFYWEPLQRQVRIQGEVEPVTPEEADAYFASRSKARQVGAWASQQSQPLEGAATLLKRVAHYTAKYAMGEVPRPDYWSGYRVIPNRIEFWENGKARLHTRRVFTRNTGEDGWASTLLYP